MMHTLEIKNRRVYLDGVEVKGVTSYALGTYAGSPGVAELTLMLLVKDKSPNSVSVSDDGTSQDKRIRQIVREEIAAHKERLDPNAVAEALGQHIRDQRVMLGNPDPFEHLESAETPETHE